jgi:hypothetical protein
VAALRACFVSPDRFQGCVSRDQTLPPVRLIILEVHGGLGGEGLPIRGVFLGYRRIALRRGLPNADI